MWISLREGVDIVKTVWILIGDSVYCYDTVWISLRDGMDIVKNRCGYRLETVWILLGDYVDILKKVWMSLGEGLDIDRRRFGCRLKTVWISLRQCVIIRKRYVGIVRAMTTQCRYWNFCNMGVAVARRDETKQKRY